MFSLHRAFWGYVKLCYIKWPRIYVFMYVCILCMCVCIRALAWHPLSDPRASAWLLIEITELICLKLSRKLFLNC